EQVADTLFKYAIVLPHPLAVGENHDIAIRVRIPEGQPMVPRYVVHPVRRIDMFALRIRFDPGDMPEAVWRADGVPSRVVSAGEYVDIAEKEIVALDPHGEVATRFDDLKIGLA